MKRSFILAGCLAFSMSLLACGGDSGTSSDNVDREKKQVSSSSTTSSSSSEKIEESSSSVDSNLPKGTRPAKLDDFGKNYLLEGLFKTKVYLATGAQQGVISIWLPDSAWIAVRSNLKDGVLELDPEYGYYEAIEGKGNIDSVKALIENKTTFTFVYDEEESQLQYSRDGKNFFNLEPANVKLPSGDISKASDLDKNRFSCKKGDTTHVFSFYKKNFTWVKTVESDTASWLAGVYDIQRGKLLLLPEYYVLAVSPLMSASVSTGKETILFSTQVKYSCTAKEFSYSSIAKEDLIYGWDSEEDGYSWSMDLEENGSFELNGQGKDFKKVEQGFWDIYEDVLVLKVKKCSDGSACASGIMGKVSEFKRDKGFTYVHTDINKIDGKVDMPTKWTPANYE